MPKPLDGLRVLELGQLIAGPFAAKMLGEFGAEVIKIEPPGTGDPLRKWRLLHDGTSVWWAVQSRNKKSVTLDLRKPQGVALFKRLVEKADVVLENFRPGTLERWGIGYDVLRKINPGLVMLRISAYGQTGPYRDKPGYARIAHAFSGLAYLAREPGGTPVIPGSTSLADYTSGLYGAVGVLMALRVRDRTGTGQVVDLGVYEPIFRMMDELVPSYGRSGFVREPLGADTVNIVPHSHYLSRDGRWVAIACSSDRMFERLCVAMGKPGLGHDPRYATMRQRDLRRAEVNGMVSAWVAGLTAAEIMKRCDDAEMAGGILYNIQDIFEDPQYAARGNIARMEQTRVGAFDAPAVVPKLSGTPGRLDSLGPALGSHNEEIYREWLGLDADEIAGFKSSKVI
jgi:crotonobetainyl-CoA:carnitine CoA-transferase CaiB-like acyl-CoA transferase